MVYLLQRVTSQKAMSVACIVCHNKGIIRRLCYVLVSDTGSPPCAFQLLCLGFSISYCAHDNDGTTGSLRVLSVPLRRREV